MEVKGQNGGPGLEEILDNELVGEYFGKSSKKEDHGTMIFFILF